MFDWNDLKYVLAVAESGSTLAAAQALGVSQTTVARRIAALDTAVGPALLARQVGLLMAAFDPCVAYQIEAAQPVQHA